MLGLVQGGVNRPLDRLIQGFSTFPSTLTFVFSQEKWQNPLVPVENGAPKRGGRLSASTGFSRVITARLPDVVGAAGA